MKSFALMVNGRAVHVAAEHDAPLLDVLRNVLGLTGTRFGCGLEQCGACNVLVGDAAMSSCTLAIDAVQGRPITTIEGLGTPAAPHPVQQAFLDEQAAQCGYCTAGMIVSAAALLRRNPAPDRAAIDAALDRNLCRCGSHARIVRAVQRAARASGGEA